MRPIYWSSEKVLEKIREHHKVLGRKPSKYEVGSLYLASRKFFGTWGNALRFAGYDVKPFQKAEIPATLTKELAYFLGIVLSDGHVVYNKERGDYAVKVYTSYADEKHLLVRLIKKLFNYDARLRTRQYGFNKVPNFEIIVSSKSLANLLIDKFEIPSGKKSHIIRVPKVFWNNVLFFDLLRGIIDGDGGIDKQGVSIFSSSKCFLEDIIFILNKFKITTSKIYRSTATVYYMRIPLIESMRLFGKLYRKCNVFYPKLKNAWKENILTYNRKSITLPPVA